MNLYTVITDSDINDEQLDPGSSCDSSEGSCDELDDEGSGIPVKQKRRAVQSTAVKKKQKVNGQGNH